MKPREVIAKRREELGYTQVEVEEKLGFSKMTLWDIEAHDSELENNLGIGEIRLLAIFLKIPILCLLGEFCPICKQQNEDIELDIDIPQLIKYKREKKGLSLSELGDIVGVYNSVIEKIEKTPDGIEELNTVMLKALSKALDIPLLTLLSRKCATCKMP